MKTKAFKLMATLFVAALSLGFTACGGDDDDDNGGNGGNTPNELVDPAGTAACVIIYGTNIHGQRSNPSYGSMGEYSMYLSDLEFRTSGTPGGTIASVGTVKGLADIKSIPTSGYSEWASFLPGFGYVAKMDDGVYVRMYAVDYVKDGNGNIIGVQFKYQYPFEP